MGDAAEAAEGGTSMTNLWASRSGAMVIDDTAQASLINSYMQQSLARANRDRRLVGGFKNVLDVVQREGSSVLFCILPENLWNDKTHSAFFALVLSACYQNGVRMIKVDQDQLVRKIVEATSDPGHPAPDLSSYECLAVMDGDTHLTCDTELVNFYESHDHRGDFDRLPIINLMES